MNLLVPTAFYGKSVKDIVPQKENIFYRFIGHIRTNKENLAITLSMLRFGQIIKGLRSHEVIISEDEENQTVAVLEVSIISTSMFYIKKSG